MPVDEIRRSTPRDAPDERLTPLVGERSIDRSLVRATRGANDLEPASSADEATPADVAIDVSLVTESLDEILLAMIGSTAEETHGTGLMEELEQRFDTQLSPGTVYPRLHELEADDILDVHELVHTKQYSISDRSAARGLIERAMNQHFAIARFLQAALKAD